MPIWIEKYKHILIVAFVVIIISLFTLSNMLQKKEAAVPEPVWEQQGLEQEEKEEGQQPESSHKMYVDLKGAVKNPGLYEVEDGERVHDVLAKAGGLLEKADEKQVNFAMKLFDEMVIYIPEISEEGGDIQPLSEQGKSQAQQVNINRADAMELEELPGIGPSKAATIIQYREENGAFKDIEELMNISGIGEKTFEKLKEHIKTH